MIIMAVFWDKGVPVATTDKKEAKRLKERMFVIAEVLSKHGYGHMTYNEAVNHLTKTDMDKYFEIVKEIQTESKKVGC